LQLMDLKIMNDYYSLKKGFFMMDYFLFALETVVSVFVEEAKADSEYHC